jgi:tRNA modification GTPase
MYEQDTIGAISTAIGASSIGIIRMSGPNAIGIAEKIFRFAGKRKDWSGFQMHYGHIIHPDSGTVIDEVLLSVMLSPKSYTRENMVEIYSHGGYVSMRQILQLVMDLGARPAEPGEFTKRAFLNGRIDLSQAEAVADIIRAKTDISLDLAVRQLSGDLSAKVQEIMGGLIELSAFLEVAIDYPEDDVQELEWQEVKERIESAKKMLEELLASSHSGKILREGLKTVILGKPNVGKSSLLNALLKENRAIVTEIPGTTRDIIEETINLSGIPLQIVDTAGIRDTEDVVEQLGVDRAVEYAKKADLILFVLDDSVGITESDRKIIEILAGRNTIVLINKTDISPSKINAEEAASLVGSSKIIRISVKEGSGMKDLEQEILSMVYSGGLHAEESMIVTNVRHIHLLKTAESGVSEALYALEAGIPVDMVSIDVRNAVQSLGEIIGTHASDELLDTIFSQFCVGK